MTRAKSRIMSCEFQERGPYLLEVLQVLGHRRSPEDSEINVAMPIIECQIQKYWVHGVEVSEDARRDKLRRPQPNFWRKSWNHHHGGNPDQRLNKEDFQTRHKE